MAQAARPVAAVPGEKVVLTRRRPVQAEGDQTAVVQPSFQDSQLPGGEGENVDLVLVQVAVLQSRGLVVSLSRGRRAQPNGNGLLDPGVVDVLEAVGWPMGIHFQAQQLQFPTAASAQALLAQAGHLDGSKVDGGARGDDRRWIELYGPMIDQSPVHPGVQVRVAKVVALLFVAGHPAHHLCRWRQNKDVAARRRGGDRRGAVELLWRRSRCPGNSHRLGRRGPFHSADPLGIARRRWRIDEREAQVEDGQDGHHPRHGPQGDPQRREPPAAVPVIVWLLFQRSCPEPCPEPLGFARDKLRRRACTEPSLP
jgi:hypothetical protein